MMEDNLSLKKGRSFKGNNHRYEMGVSFVI